MANRKDSVGQNELPPDYSMRQARRNKNKSQVVSITYEEIGLFPRSFSRVLDRFFQQLFSDVDNLIVQEYRFYRFLFLTTLKTLFVLIFLPIAINLSAKNYIVKPVAEYLWNGQNTEIFLNSYQQTKAFAELNDFEEKLYFESLLKIKKATPTVGTLASQPLLPSHVTYGGVEGSRGEGVGSPVQSIIKTLDPKQGSSFIPDKAQLYASTPFGICLRQGSNGHITHVYPRDVPLTEWETPMGVVPRVGSVVNTQQSKKTLRLDNALALQPSLPAALTIAKLSAASNPDPALELSLPQKLQEKTLQLAVHYNDESIEAITNIFSDLLSFLTLVCLVRSLEIQINITKSFLLEVFFGLEDSKKCLLILLTTDLLVGYHSPGSWEIFLESLFEHYGLVANHTVVLLLVATLPVLLDVLFKYLIFRHLNRSSPATVATYQALIE